MPESRPRAHLENIPSQDKDDFERNHSDRTPKRGLYACLDDIAFDTESYENDCEDDDNPYIDEPGWRRSWEQETENQSRRFRLLEERRDVANYRDEKEELKWFSIQWGS